MPISRLPLLLLALLPLASCAMEPSSGKAACGKPGEWISHDGSRARKAEPIALIERLASSQVALLGELHDSAEDHRWQLHTLAQLHARHPQLAVGFEMFPRRLQPVLDRWVAGELSEAEFLKQAEWGKVWTYPAQLYLPLFHYARMNRIPMLALNIERSLVEAIDEKGWDAVPEAQREGVSRPAPPPEGYTQMLRMVFNHHPEKKHDEASFARFTQAQTTWDRAMAEVIAAHLKRHPDALVVGIMGAGHVQFGYGVAHQLKDLGISRVANLTTWDVSDACDEYQPGQADAVYVVQRPQANPPRLGISMEPAKDGVRIAQVVPDSVAEKAGLKAGDLVSEAAGMPIESPQDMSQAVQRQAPGTWLPIKVRRDGKELELVARFPAER